jgi:hypothetical protein
VTTMLTLGLLALITAALFTGAAIYVSVAEQPARLVLDNRAMLVQWRHSYDRAAPMQAGLAAVSAMLGAFACWQSGDWRWLAGALLILTNWPFTLFIIRPTNNVLHAVSEKDASQSTKTLIEWWGLLHMVRGLLGVIATLAYFWALN